MQHIGKFDLLDTRTACIPGVLLTDRQSWSYVLNGELIYNYELNGENRRVNLTKQSRAFARGELKTHEQVQELVACMFAWCTTHVGWLKVALQKSPNDEVLKAKVNQSVLLAKQMEDWMNSNTVALQNFEEFD